MMLVRDVPGELGRFYVGQQGKPEKPEYLVDVAEFGGNGWCGCLAFEYHHLKAAQADRAGISRCKHLIGVFALLDEERNES